MVDKFLRKDTVIEYTVLPIKKENFDISISNKDTIVIFIDLKEMDIDEAKILLKTVEKHFPENKVLALPKDMAEIGVIRNE